MLFCTTAAMTFQSGKQNGYDYKSEKKLKREMRKEKKGFLRQVEESMPIKLKKKNKTEGLPVSAKAQEILASILSDLPAQCKSLRFGRTS